MGLDEDLQQVAAAASQHSCAGEELAAVIPTEPTEGKRVFLCAYRAANEDSRTWLALDHEGEVIDERRLVREAVAIAALCEAAEDAAGLRFYEAVDTPRLATPTYLDELGTAVHDRAQPSAAAVGFADAMRVAAASVQELELEVERGYKVPLR